MPRLPMGNHCWAINAIWVEDKFLGKDLLPQTLVETSPE